MILSYFLSSELTDIVNLMWKIDRKQLRSSEDDVVLSFQGMSSKTNEDFAPNPLIESVNPRLFRRRSFKGITKIEYLLFYTLLKY